MKQILLSLFIICFCQSAQAIVPGWIWAKIPHITDQGQCNSVATDPTGNIYITGYFGSDSITFGAFTLYNQASGANMFLVKYDPTGNVLWAKSGGLQNLCEANAVTTDVDGSVYITGYYSTATCNFDNDTLRNNGLSNAFVVKYNPSGSVMWARSIGGTRQDYGASINTDGTGNVYITGYFMSPQVVIGYDTLHSSIYYSTFLTKFTTNGTPVWARQSNATVYAIPTGVCTDNAGNIYITGSYSGSPYVVFGNDTLRINITNVTSDVYLVKYNSAGNILWAKSFGGNYADYSSAVCTDPSGNVYVTGGFLSYKINFAGTTFMNTDSNGYSDYFLFKFSSTGNELWGRTAGGLWSEAGAGLTVDASGNIYSCGYFQSPYLYYGTDSIKNDTTSASMSLRSPDIFMFKYNPAGNLYWAKTAGGASLDMPYGMASDTKGNLYIGGSSNGNPFKLGSISLFCNNGSEPFLAKLNSTLETEELQIENDPITIYPNPTKGYIVIKLNGQNYSELKIYNLMGKMVYSQPLESNISNPQLTMNTGQLISGIYLVQVIGQDGVITRQVVVE